MYVGAEYAQYDDVSYSSTLAAELVLDSDEFWRACIDIIEGDVKRWFSYGSASEAGVVDHSVSGK
jgi:hypothetical protein